MESQSYGASPVIWEPPTQVSAPRLNPIHALHAGRYSIYLPRYNCRTEHREMLSSSSVVDGSEVGGAAGVSRSEPVMSSGRDDGGPVNPSPSSTDAGSLSTLAMIILSYNKNDVRLAIDNVRKGMPRQYFFQHVLCNVIKPFTFICLSIYSLLI